MDFYRFARFSSVLVCLCSYLRFSVSSSSMKNSIAAIAKEERDYSYYDILKIFSNILY